jgi:hypothetical protein
MSGSLTMTYRKCRPTTLSADLLRGTLTIHYLAIVILLGAMGRTFNGNAYRHRRRRGPPAARALVLCPCP